MKATISPFVIGIRTSAASSTGRVVVRCVYIDDLPHLMQTKAGSGWHPVSGPLLRQQDIQPIEELVDDANSSPLDHSAERVS